MLREAIDARGAGHLALAGGSTPRRAYELLAGELDDWSGVTIWFGDERAVGPDNPESNYRLAVETLVESGGPSVDQIRRIEGERGSEAAAETYAASLRDELPASAEGLPVLDLALQGLGPDAHTASLFPRNPAVGASGICLPVHDAPKPPPDRITMTVGVLRAARRIVFLVTGAEKRDAVAKLLGAPDPAAPASLLGGDATDVIVDREAAPEG